MRFVQSRDARYRPLCFRNVKILTEPYRAGMAVGSSGNEKTEAIVSSKRDDRQAHFTQ
jgi:hypothetical protein